jgi:hypothetical protein
MDAHAMAPPPLSEPLVPLRPSTMILREFIDDEKPLNWKTIPDKLERLCQSMEHWVGAVSAVVLCALPHRTVLIFN